MVLMADLVTHAVLNQYLSLVTFFVHYIHNILLKNHISKVSSFFVISLSSICSNTEEQTTDNFYLSQQIFVLEIFIFFLTLPILAEKSLDSILSVCLNQMCILFNLSLSRTHHVLLHTLGYQECMMPS